MMKRLDAAAVGMSGDEVIDMAADAIDRTFRNGVPQDGARGGRDLRLSESGDAYSEWGARRLAQTTARWEARGGGTVFGFTHLGLEIPRDAFGGIKMAASVETVEAADAAYERGYLPALVVPKFESKTPYILDGSHHGLKAIPCRYEVTKDDVAKKTCVECRLCLDRTPKNSVILFEPHGSGRREVVEQLIAPNAIVRRKR